MQSCGGRVDRSRVDRSRVDRSGIDRDELIGREPERAQLDTWVGALAGHGSLVLLAGEAGVGKTTLAKHTLDRSGFRCLEGFAVQGGTSPFGPIVEGLRSYLRAAGDVPLVEGPSPATSPCCFPSLARRPRR